MGKERKPGKSSAGSHASPIDPERRVNAREWTSALAHTALDEGQATAWFEQVYARAKGDESFVPWADLAPHPLLAGLLDQAEVPTGARTLVVGCGLGDDASDCLRRGFDVEGFDLSETAVAWAKKRHPELDKKVFARDLFELPKEWSQRFALIVEIYTLQSLPQNLRDEAFAAIARVLKPGGALLVIFRPTPEGMPLEAKRSGPPWPIAPEEMLAWAEQHGLAVEHSTFATPTDPPTGRGRCGMVLRSAAAN